MSNLHFPNDSIDAGSVYDSKLEMTQEEINEALSGTAIENLVKYPYVKNSYSNTSGTLTGTVNADGSVTINGETLITGNTNFDLNDSRNCATLQPGTYVLSGASENVALSVHYIQQDDSAWSADVLNAAEDSHVYTFAKVTKFRIATRVAGAKTISSETVYPMLEIGNVAHDFVPPGEPSSSLFVRVADLEKAVGNGIPVYWENYLADKITAIQKAQEDSGLSGDSFVFLTDYHYTFNAQNSPALIRRILEACGIGKVLFAGDLINHNDAITSTDEVLADITSALDTLTSGVMEHCFTVDGNHEHHMVGYPDYDPGHAVLYSMLAKRQELHIGWVDAYGSYWVDNVPQKIRYFFLSCEANAVTTAEAGASVAAELANVPAGYTVVLVTHHAIVGATGEPCVEYERN